MGDQVRAKTVVVRSGPAAAALGLQAAAEMARQGERVALCLLQDGVLCALRAHHGASGALLARALEAGVELRYLEEDLAARGFEREHLRAEARPIGYGDLVELMLEDGRQLLGAF